MQRKYLCASLVVAMLAVSAVVWTLTRSSADQGDPHAPAIGKQASPLPIAQVVLFNSGVGYIQREGEVSGATRVELTFPTSDINDLLKSLVLQDTAGGKVEAISYDSQDPVDKILRSFALDLNNNPSFGQILNQARGEKIEVMRQEKPGSNPHKVTGTIIGMESHREVVGKDAWVDVEQLNLLMNEGMLSIPLAQVLSVHFENKTLESEFRRALQVLAGSHDVQKKTVSLQFSGNGKRAVKVGYVVEKPIWKTTYRLVLEPNGKLFMQGWAIVENTSDDDWNNIRMVLVSGKPISYRMDLYEPLYIPRPLVEPELFASLRPPVYGGSIGGDIGLQGAFGPGFVVPGGGMGQGGIGGQFGGVGQYGALGQFGGGVGQYGGGVGQFGGKQGIALPPGSDKNGRDLLQIQPNVQNQVQQIPQGNNALNFELTNNTKQKLAYDEMVKRKEMQKADIAEGKKMGSTIAGLNYKEGVQSIASSEEVGDYYQYVIDQKISLARQKSAMLPIVNQTIEGSKVSIYNEAVHAKYPLLGIRLKNTAGKPLTQGPITVYDDGSYAGDTRTLDLQPNEERLLSYALDQGTEVKTEIKTHPAPDMTFNIGGDNLTAVYTMRQTRTYTLKNRTTKDRTVIIEHAIRSDWKLVDPKKPSDRSRDVYRFQVTVKAGETVKQEVVEDQQRTDPVALITPAKDVPPRYAVVTGIEVKPEVKASPHKLLSLSIFKGVLQETYKQSESKTYFIQNQSDRDHNFTIDHVIRKEWKRLGKDGKDQIGPDVYRFKVDVKSKQSAKQEVMEERVYPDHTKMVANLGETELRKFIANPAPSAKVKDALQQVVDMQTKLKTVTHDLATMKIDLKVLADDQARVRDNLKIIPQSSEPYSNFLKKFVAQETQIEEAQRQIRTEEATVQKLQKEYETFVTGLTVQ